MPNYCLNYLKVRGDADQAKAFLVRLEGGGFGAFIPEPPDSDNEWRIKHWGDKWDSGTDEAQFDIDCLKCKFTTAYTPPAAWFERVAVWYPALTLEMWYEESRERLWGWMKSEDGILTVAKEEMLAECDDGPDEDSPMSYRAYRWYVGKTIAEYVAALRPEMLNVDKTEVLPEDNYPE